MIVPVHPHPGQRQLTQEAIRDIKHEGRRGIRHHVEAAEESAALSYLI